MRRGVAGRYTVLHYLGGGPAAALLLCGLLACAGRPAPDGAPPTDANPDAPAVTASPDRTAAELLGDPALRAVSYGGYRATSRDVQPTIAQLREDLLLMHAMGIRVLRTYNVHLAHAANVLAAIRDLRAERPGFELYVMLGAWIDAHGAWTGGPVDHERESARNADEIARAVELARAYPEVVKVIAVGNEAMVHWAAAYRVHPRIVLRWVRHLQGLKRAGELPAGLWVTSSDNFASWGGGGAEYHLPELDSLIGAVDFLSVHTYPMHDTHYNPAFWGVTPAEEALGKEAAVRTAMRRSLGYARAQLDAVRAYADSLGHAGKPIHVGETGWASSSDGLYGPEGSRACDEYKQALYHELIRGYTDSAGMACFYFEAFDEPWKDAGNPAGSENFFGLFTVDGRAKYALWPLVDAGVFDGLTRGGRPITKTYGGDLDALLREVALPPVRPRLAD